MNEEYNGVCSKCNMRYKNKERHDFYSAIYNVKGKGCGKYQKVWERESVGGKK